MCQKSKIIYQLLSFILQAPYFEHIIPVQGPRLAAIQWRHLEIQTKIKSNDITVVTAYFDLGDFQKGHQGFYKSSTYREWMKILGKIKNKLVVYLEKAEDMEYVAKIRKHLPPSMTVIHQVQRDYLWAFSLNRKIKYIYNDWWLPKHHPNTVLSEYSCAMHAKYELLSQTILQNYTDSKYLAWMDIGCFRDFVNQTEDFILKVPVGFNDSFISYSQVDPRNTNLTPKTIMWDNLVWVGGAFVLGQIDLMRKWTWIYMQFVDYFLQQGLMNSDQQIIYAAANINSTFRNMIKVHKNGKNEHLSRWFYLGIKCKQAGQNK